MKKSVLSSKLIRVLVPFFLLFFFLGLAASEPLNEYERCVIWAESGVIPYSNATPLQRHEAMEYASQWFHVKQELNKIHMYVRKFEIQKIRLTGAFVIYDCLQSADVIKL